jgi:hypothetical protein
VSFLHLLLTSVVDVVVAMDYVVFAQRTCGIDAQPLVHTGCMEVMTARNFPQMQHSCMWKQLQIREVLTYSVTAGFYIWCKQPKASVHPMFLMMLKYKENAKTVINILSFSSTLESSEQAYSECELCISTK